MKPVLYYLYGSPPARTVMMLVRYLDIDVEFKVVDQIFFRSEEFEALNPSRKIPVLKDGDFVISESIAICHYLILKSGTDKPLLGVGAKEKATVTHRLCYSVGTLFQKLCNIATPLYVGETNEIDDRKKNAIEHEFCILDKFLSQHEWAAANYITLADLSLVTIVTSLMEIGFKPLEYSNISKWISNCEGLPGWDENIKGSKTFGYAIKNFMNKSAQIK